MEGLPSQHKSKTMNVLRSLVELRQNMDSVIYMIRHYINYNKLKLYLNTLFTGTAELLIASTRVDAVVRQPFFFFNFFGFMVIFI